MAPGLRQSGLNDFVFHFVGASDISIGADCFAVASVFRSANSHQHFYFTVAVPYYSLVNGGSLFDRRVGEPD